MRVQEVRRDVAAVLAEAVEAVEAATAKAKAILEAWQGPNTGGQIRCRVCAKLGHNSRRHAE